MRRPHAWRLGRLLPLLTIPLVFSPAHASTGIDVQENFFGATNINAVTGHGRLTVGVSRDGDITVLSWPGPSYADQLAYLSSNGLDARQLPRFGAPEGAGLFLGLVVEQGASRTVTWLRDRSVWQIDQSYGSANGPNPHTVHRSDALGLTVEVVDAVAPAELGADLLVRQVRVDRDADSPVTAAWLLTYANLSPIPESCRVEKIPLVDWAFDGRNDFAAIWNEPASAVVHFHPGDQRIYDSTLDLGGLPDVDFGPIGEALQSAAVPAATIASLATGLDQAYAEGAYLALTTTPPPDQHQIGFDATPLCQMIGQIGDNLVALPDEFPEVSIPFSEEMLDLLRCDGGTPPDLHSSQGWQYVTSDAFVDAGDGELSGSGIAAGEVNEALRTALVFVDGGDGTASASAYVLVGAGHTAAAALDALTAPTSPAAVVVAAEDEVLAWIADRRLPAESTEEVARVARRSLINVRVGLDANVGALVASIARQPPYYLDWPRDGAFFNLLLDVSGQSERVDLRTALYDSWQRKQAAPRDRLIDLMPPMDPDTRDDEFYPGGGWEMSYLADGSPGGLFRFEIDTTAFAVWTLVAHVGWVAESERETYLRARWDAIRMGADLLARWRDAETGLQAPAQEDDAGDYVQTIHGAASTFGALEIASRAARLLGEDEDARRWEERAGELREAILENFYDPDERRFIMGGTARGPFAASGLTPTGPTAWAVWPMSLLPLDDERMQEQIAYDMDVVRPMIELETAGGLYFMKTTNAAGVAQLGLPEAERETRRAELAEIVTELADQASPTDQFGEVIVVEDDGEGPRADQRVATPHLWESSLFYLTAIAVEDPEALLRYDQVLPASRVPEPGSGGGCGCRTTRSSTDRRPPLGAGLFAAVCLLALLGRRRA